MSKQIERSIVVSTERRYTIGGTSLRVLEQDGKPVEFEASALGWETFIPAALAEVLRDLLSAALSE